MHIKTHNDQHFTSSFSHLLKSSHTLTLASVIPTIYFNGQCNNLIAVSRGDLVPNLLPPGPPSQGTHLPHLLALSFDLPGQQTSTLSSVSSKLAKLRVAPSVGDSSPLWSVKWRFMTWHQAQGVKCSSCLFRVCLGCAEALHWPQPEWSLGPPWSLGSQLYSVTSSVTLFCSMTHSRDRNLARIPGEASHQVLFSPWNLFCLVYYNGTQKHRHK